MKTKVLVAYYPLGPGWSIGHSSSDRKRTSFGVYVFGSCIIILYQIQALGGRSLPHHRWHSGLERPSAVAQKREGAVFKLSELGLGIFFVPCSASAITSCQLLGGG